MAELVYIPIDNRGRAVVEFDLNAKLDYTWDWKDPVEGWLIPDDDQIFSCTVTGYDGVEAYDVAHDGRYVTAWIRAAVGAEVGNRARATAHIVTVEGREDDRSIYFKLRER